MFSFCFVVVFLGSYVVKLGKAKTKTKREKPPQKVKGLPGIFTRQVMVACAKVIVFGPFCCFCLVVPKTL